MEKSMLLMLLVFSGLNILPSCLSFQYEFVNEEKNWYDAQKYCRENYTDLATIYDNATNPLEKNFTNGVWIGLSSGSWKWSLNDTMLNYSYTNFNTSSVSNTGKLDENTVCAKMDNRHWNNISCSTSVASICYDSNNSRKYICIHQEKTWNESQSYCRENHTDLVSVKDQAEHNAIFESLRNTTGPCNKGFWIGLSRVKWQWSDQSTFNLQNWHTGEPNGGFTEQCVEMYYNSSRWNDEPCDKTKSFICYDDDLVLVKMNKTWVEALDHCRSEGWDLVSVHSARVQHWVQRRARNATTPYVWLGLRYSCALQVWFWVSEHGLCYQNWAQGHGGSWEECKKVGAMPREGPQKWEGKNQTEKFNFICTKKPDDY